MIESNHKAWDGGKCRVPMWMAGFPAGFCDVPANGPQLPMEVLFWSRAWRAEDRPYCFGPCCPNHGGPKDGEPIVFQDGYTEKGRQMWCAVMPDFEDLQISPAGFSGNGNEAIRLLREEIAKGNEGQP